jgi:hypothetical protein
MIDRAMFPRRVVARESELDRLGGFLAGPELQSFVLRGEPGIGKTLLWQIAVEDATAQGVKVLVHRAAEAEAGLADLVEQSTGGLGPRARQVDGPCVGEANRRRIAGRRARRHPLVLAMLSGSHAQCIGELARTDVVRLAHHPF